MEGFRNLNNCMKSHFIENYKNYLFFCNTNLLFDYSIVNVLVLITVKLKLFIFVGEQLLACLHLVDGVEQVFVAFEIDQSIARAPFDQRAYRLLKFY